MVVRQWAPHLATKLVTPANQVSDFGILIDGGRLCGSQFLRAIGIDRPAHPACGPHDVVFRVKAANDGKEVFINPSAEIIAQERTGVGMMHDEIAQ